MSNVNITNCILSNNYAAYSGGVLGYWWSCDSTISNCTIVGNIAEVASVLATGYLPSDPDRPPSTVTINNSILWNGDNQIWNNDCSTIDITYSNVQGGWPGDGNIDVDPLFSGPDGPDNDCSTWEDNNYHLKSQGKCWDPVSQVWVYDNITSLCIDAGNPGCDPDNESTVGCGRINMGAYGGTAEASIPPDNWASIADINNDRKVNWGDFGVFAAYWLQTGDCLPADLNRDGVVNWGDFSFFATDWLWGI